MAVAMNSQPQQHQHVVIGYKIVDHDLKSLVNPSPDPNEDLRFQFVVGQHHLLLLSTSFWHGNVYNDAE